MAYRTTPRMAERKAARRRKLLATATSLFGRHGYHATTVPMIVKKAQSSIGNFYFYFRNKEDIFAAALAALGERIAAALNQAIAAAGPDSYRQMKAAVHALVAFLAQNPAEARILIVESSGLGGRLEQVRRSVISSHARSVERAIAGLGTSSAIPRPEVAARCWVGALYEAVYHWLEQPPGERLPPERIADAVVQFNLRGIGAGSEVL